MAFYTKVKLLQKGTNNELWLLSENQIRRAKVVWNQREKALTLKTLPIGSVSQLTTSQLNPQIAVSEKGEVWLSGFPWLSAYVPDKGRLKALPEKVNNIGSGIVKMLYADGYLWVIYRDSLVKYACKPDNTYAIVAKKEFDLNKHLLSLTLSGQYVWVVNEESIFQLDKNSLSLLKEHSHSPLNPYSASNHINSVFLDKDSNLWVSAWSNGVSYSSTRDAFFKTVWIKPQSKVGSEFVSTMHYDPDGFVYIGNKFGGVIRFHTQSQQLDELYCNAPELSPNVTSIQSDKAHLYVSVRERVWVIDKQSRRIISSFATQCNDYIFDIKLDTFHRLWITTYSGLECFEERNGQWQNVYTFTETTPEPRRLSTNKLHKIYVDNAKNELVITSVMGLNRLQLNAKGEVVRVLKYVADANYQDRKSVV